MLMCGWQHYLLFDGMVPHARWTDKQAGLCEGLSFNPVMLIRRKFDSCHAPSLLISQKTS